jgi:DNA-binding MarR family transcriptional regulator
MAQFGVLNHFARLGGQWAPARLADAFQVTKGTMTNTLQKLESQGFVRITADKQDGRAKVVEITERGRKIREKAVQAAGRLMTDLFETVPAAGVRASLPFLEELRITLDKNR